MPWSRGLYDHSTGGLFIVPSIAMLGLFALPLVALAERTAGGDVSAYALSPAALTAISLSMVTSLTTVLITTLVGTPWHTRSQGGSSR